jgi:hypothetical protein
MKKLLLIVAGILLVPVMIANAHHSSAATYDGNKMVKIRGQLVLFLFRNPHVFVHMDVPDENGKPQRWTIEWGGPTQLGGQGVTRDTFKAGDELIVTGNPSRTAGEHRARMLTLHRVSDGFGWGNKPGEIVD